MKLQVNELQRLLLTGSTKIPFSWIIDVCKQHGYTASEIKKCMIWMQEKGIVEIEKEDFVIIDYMFE
jgi:hypothetical protein